MTLIRSRKARLTGAAIVGFLGSLTATWVILSSIFAQASPSVFLTDASGSIGQTIPVDLRIADFPNGLSGLEIFVEITDPKVANIYSIDDLGNMPLKSSAEDLPFHSTDFAGVDLFDAYKGVIVEATILTFSVQLLSPGVTDIVLTVHSMDDDSGSPMRLDITNGIITVGRNASTLPFTMTKSVSHQIDVWVAEFDAELAVTPFDLGQVELYDLLKAAERSGTLDTTLLTSRMIAAATEIVESYFAVDRHRYESKGGVLDSSVSRTEMRDFLNMLVSASGSPIVVSRQVPESLNVMGFGKGNTQFAVPNANDGTTSWSQFNGDGDGDWFDELDEGFPADDLTTSWQSPNNPASIFITTALQTLTDPAVSTGHIYRTRNRKHDTAGRQIDFVISLREGGVERATQTFVNAGVLWTTRSDTLSGAEADAITDYADLEIRTTAVVSGGGPARRGEESSHEMEVPDAPVGGRRGRLIIVSMGE